MVCAVTDSSPLSFTRSESSTRQAVPRLAEGFHYRPRMPVQAGGASGDGRMRHVGRSVYYPANSSEE
jgi:hypothetical protein